MVGFQIETNFPKSLSKKILKDLFQSIKGNFLLSSMFKCDWDTDNHALALLWLTTSSSYEKKSYFYSSIQQYIYTINVLLSTIVTLKKKKMLLSRRTIATWMLHREKPKKSFSCFYRINSGCVIWMSVCFMSHGCLCLWLMSKCLTQKKKLYKAISQRDTDKKLLWKICVVVRLERREDSLIKPPFLQCIVAKENSESCSLTTQLTCW